MPPLAELGLEHLVPVLMGGGQVALDAETVGVMLQSIADGAKKHASRRLVAVARASADELFLWESSPEARAIAEKAAALLGWEEARGCVLGFFTSLGLSPPNFPASSEIGKPLQDPGETSTPA